MARCGLRTLATLVGKRLIEIDGYKGRATSDEMTERREALYAICEEMHPITVRGVFYQATVRGRQERLRRTGRTVLPHNPPPVVDVQIQ